MVDHTFSASQITTGRSCKRKWHYGSIQGIKTDSGPAAALGTEVHGQLERWMTKKEVPTHAAARRLLPLLPLPSEHLVAEYPFRFLLSIGAVRGFIDLLIKDPAKIKNPPFNDIPTVVDYKTSGNLLYAKTDDDLRTDAQAVIYGVAARLAVAPKVSDVPEVGLLWQYTSTRRNETTRASLRQSLPILEDGLGPLIEDARGLLAYAEADVEDVPGNSAACGAFGGCPFKDRCSHFRNFGARSASESLLDALDRPQPPAKETTMPDPDLLARLRAASQKKDPEPAAAAPKTDAAPAADAAVKPSPEPTLQPFDTKGTEVPPPAPVAINPPDAAPNMTPETAPKASAEPKPKKGKKAEEQSLLDLTESLLRLALVNGEFDKAHTLCGIRSHLMCP